MKIKTITPGILTVATFLGFPPFVFKYSNEKIIGIDVQYLIKFGKQHKKVRFEEQEVFDGLWKLPGENKIFDIAAAGITLNKLRQNESPGTTWSNSYYNVKRSFITLIENNITKVEDLSGKTVVVKKNSTADLDLLEHIRKYNVQNVTILYSNDMNESIQLVLEGKVFASGSGVLTNQYVASKYSNIHVVWIHDILLPSGNSESEDLSFPTRTKSIGLVEALNKFIDDNKYDTDVVIPVPAPAPVFFDQVVKGNVYIKQMSKNKYKITFRKIDNFLKYQVWSDSSKNLNERRIVYYQKAKKWVQDFILLNTNLKKKSKPLFTPTAVIEIGNNKYVFVLDKAKLNCKDRIVFNVSTKEIVLLNSTSKKMLKIPCGHHDDVRFDIDSVSNQSVDDNAVTANTFQTDVINSFAPVLVYFWAEWCGPCRSFYPTLKEISNEHRITLKTLNVDNYPEIADKYKITSTIPQTLVFVNREVVKQIIGIKSKYQMLEELKGFIA